MDNSRRTYEGQEEREKKKPDHWVPLSPQAVELLNSLPREKGNPWVFIGGKSGVPRLDNSSVSKLPTRLGYNGVNLPKCTTHGMRSVFGEWGTEVNGYSTELCKLCWSHAVGDMTTQAYLRFTKFNKRREAMNYWASDLITPSLKPLRTPEMAVAEAKERQRISNRESRLKHRDERNAATAKWIDDHYEEVHAKKRAEYAANPEPMKAYQVDYRAANREITRAYQRGYRAGLRKELSVPRHREHIHADVRSLEAEKAYQTGYRAGKERAKKGRSQRIPSQTARK